MPTTPDGSDRDQRAERSLVMPRRIRWTGLARLIAGLAIAGSLAACEATMGDLQSALGGQPKTSEAESGPQIKSPDTAGKNDADQEGPRLTQFTDIPIPANAEVDMDNLLVLGSEDGWIGRLALTTGHSMTDMYAFYEREMPRFGWNKITIVRSAITTMTYSRGMRIATITL